MAGEEQVRGMMRKEYEDGWDEEYVLYSVTGKKKGCDEEGYHQCRPVWERCVSETLRGSPPMLTLTTTNDPELGWCSVQIG